MLQVKDEKITKKNRIRFNNIKSLSEIWRHRVLKFICRASRQNADILPRKFLSASVNDKLSFGRPFRKCKDTMVESVRILMISTPESGNFKHWCGCVSDSRKWNDMISILHSKTYPCHSTSPCPNTRSRNPNHFEIGNSSDPLPSPPTSPHSNLNSRSNNNPRTPLHQIIIDLQILVLHLIFQQLKCHVPKLGNY